MWHKASSMTTCPPSRLACRLPGSIAARGDQAGERRQRLKLPFCLTGSSPPWLHWPTRPQSRARDAAGGDTTAKRAFAVAEAAGKILLIVGPYSGHVRYTP